MEGRTDNGVETGAGRVRNEEGLCNGTVNSALQCGPRTGVADDGRSVGEARSLATNECSSTINTSANCGRQERVVLDGNRGREEKLTGSAQASQHRNVSGNQEKVLKTNTNSVSKWRHWNSRKDMNVLMESGELGLERRSRKHFEDETLRETVRYILQSNNVQLMSWGTRRLCINGARTQFPVLVRRSSVDVIWRNYARERCSYPSGVKKVGRTLLCDIASKITRGETKQRACIDYKLHALFYQNGNLIRRIIDDQVRTTVTRKELKKKLKGVCEFLKYSFITHLSEEGNDPFHNIKYALGHGKFSEDERKGQCTECNAVFKFLKDVRSEIIDSPPGLDKIIKSAGTKFELFMGHIVRKNVQEKAIGEVFQLVRDGKANQRVSVFKDFKMKVEPQRYRESTTQYYGKAGMSLHGAAVFYKPDKDTDPDYCERMKKYSEDSVGRRGRKEVDIEKFEAAKKLEEERLSMFFVDHVMDNDKRQDYA